MGQNSANPHDDVPKRTGWRGSGLGFFGVLLVGFASHAGAEPSWLFQPRLSLSEVYTDNVDLSPSGEEESDLVTVIAPGFSMSRQSARLDLKVDYQLHALFFAEDDDANRVSHRLNGLMNAELKEELLFLDASAFMGQVIVDARSPQSVDGISAGGNLTDVQAYTVSPYLRHNFSNYFTGLLRYGHEKVYTDRAIQTSETNYINAAMASGPNFGLLGWNLGYNKSREERGSSDRLDRENVNASVTYRLHPKFILIAQGGREENDFGSTVIPRNGSYWAAGATWIPNRYLSLTAMDGDRFKSASVQVTPSQRTSLSISYRERDVGLNPGSVWTGDFQHSTRRTVWQLKYFEDTQTSQRALLDALAYNEAVLDAVGSGNFTLNPDGTITINVDPGGYFTLREDIFERKRGFGSVSYRTGKSVFALGAFTEQRDYLSIDAAADRPGSDRSRGGFAEWRWQYSGRTHTNVHGNWRRTTFDSDGREDDRWYIDTMVTRALTGKARGSLGYRFTQNDSSQAGREYAENRIIARFDIEF